MLEATGIFNASDGRPITRRSARTGKAFKR